MDFGCLFPLSLSAQISKFSSSGCRWKFSFRTNAFVKTLVFSFFLLIFFFLSTTQNKLEKKEKKNRNLAFVNKTNCDDNWNWNWKIIFILGLSYFSIWFTSEKFFAVSLVIFLSFLYQFKFLMKINCIDV